MTLGTLLPPIVAATVLNILLFAGAWRASQVEERTGQAPWYLSLGISAYGLPLAFFAYFSQARPLSGGADVFGAALIAEALGAGIVYGLMQAFGSRRDQTLREHAPIIAVCAFLLIVILGASLKS